MEVLNTLLCISANIIREKSIFNPASTAENMSALSHVSKFLAFVGDTQFQTSY